MTGDSQLRGNRTVRLVATDLDGTLLRADGTISPRTQRTLEQAREMGVEVVLVTARPPRTVCSMASGLGIEGLAICCNGALVYDLERERVSAHSPLEPELARRLIRDLRDRLPGCAFALEMELIYACEPAYRSLSTTSRPEGSLLGDALELCSGPVTKLIVRHPSVAFETLYEVVGRVVGGVATVTHSGAGPVEISALGVHKAHALERSCAELGVARDEVVAFGDMPNDVPMLEWAGIGVAVANAHPDVLAAASLVTCTNEEDGVAAALELLLGIPHPTL